VLAPRFVLRHWHSRTVFDPIGGHGPANITANIFRPRERYPVGAPGAGNAVACLTDSRL